MPNVLMLSIDDLNDWTSVLGGYRGVVHTPNIDRIAARSVTFANAFCTSPGCNASRTSALTGMSPLTTGVLNNDHPMFGFVDPAKTLPAVLRAEGWVTATAGKVFHDLPAEAAARIYDRVLSPQDPPEAADKDFDQTDLTVETGHIGHFTGDPALLTDRITTDAVAAFLESYAPAPGAAGLFLSVGLGRPHYPWIVPKEYFDLYPLDGILLPEAPPGDLDDVPAFARFLAESRELDAAVAAGEHARYVQGYLAAISFADAMLGRVLDALAASSIADDTVVVLWSDHGFHLGEKGNLGKGTLWEEATRAQLMIADPSAAAAGGGVRREVVSLLDLFPTLADYAGIEAPDWLEGQSLKGLVQGGDAEGLRGTAVTLMAGSYSLRTDGFRYTRYEDGSEELYDLRGDPGEFANRADDPALGPVKAGLAAALDAHVAAHGVVQNLTDAPRVLEAGAGGRLLIAGYGADTLIGGDADNVYLVRSPDAVVVEAAGGGSDTVYARASFALPDNVETLFAESWFGPGAPRGEERLLVGNALGNRIAVNGGGGGAILRGGAGDDTLEALSADDALHGDDGDDLLRGNAGGDTLEGGAGDDLLEGHTGSDTYIVSAGHDTVRDRAQGGADRMKLSEGGGTDRIDVSAWGLADTLVRELVGADGRSRGFLLTHRPTGDSMTVAAVQGEQVVEILVDRGRQVMPWAAAVDGTAAGDSILGSAGDDTVLGLGGDDTLEGGGGSDRLDGGEGRDTASYAAAGRGMVARLGADVPPEAAAVPPAAGPRPGADALLGIEDLVGGAFGDRLIGDAGDNGLRGGGGDDRLEGRNGDDTLAGGAGRDVLTGGAGQDVFAFDSLADGAAEPGAADRIADFAGNDRIALDAIDADPRTAADDAFAFVGGAAFSGVGQVRVQQEGGQTLVALNTDADGEAEMLIVLDGLVTLSANSFAL